MITESLPSASLPPPLRCLIVCIVYLLPPDSRPWSSSVTFTLTNCCSGSRHTLNVKQLIRAATTSLTPEPRAFSHRDQNRDVIVHHHLDQDLRGCSLKVTHLNRSLFVYKHVVSPTNQVLMVLLLLKGQEATVTPENVQNVQLWDTSKHQAAASPEPASAVPLPLDESPFVPLSVAEAPGGPRGPSGPLAALQSTLRL